MNCLTVVTVPRRDVYHSTSKLVDGTSTGSDRPRRPGAVPECLKEECGR